MKKGVKFNSGDRSAFLYLPFGDSKFLEEFMTKNSLEIKYNNSIVTTLNLRQNYQVTQELIECQKTMDSTSPKKSRDPFASGSNKSRDPFAR